MHLVDELYEVLDRLRELGSANPELVWDKVLEMVPPDVLRQYREQGVRNRGSPRRWTENMITEAQSMIGQGKTYAEVGTKFGVSGERLRIVLIQAKRRHRGAGDEKRREPER